MNKEKCGVGLGNGRLRLQADHDNHQGITYASSSTFCFIRDGDDSIVNIE